MTETIVMIHGMWGGGWYWENYQKYFEEKGYRCFSPTLKYHDMNPADTPDPRLGITSILDYAHDLEKYIGDLDGTPFLMGHSMGALLAQILGARDVARGLVLLTPASPSGINALKFSVIKSFWRILTTWGFWRMSHRPTFDEVVYSVLHRLPEDEQRAVYERLVYESGRAAAEIGFWLLDPRGAAKVDESKVTCPVLVVSGAEDRITPASVNRKVANKYKAVSTYKVFENHAHWVVGEPGWENIAAYIRDWLQEIPA
ncbi:alpha/beta hydrolase [Thermodesulfobacteriota bacterium]